MSGSAQLAAKRKHSARVWVARVYHGSEGVFLQAGNIALDEVKVGFTVIFSSRFQTGVK